MQKAFNVQLRGLGGGGGTYKLLNIPLSFVKQHYRETHQSNIMIMRQFKCSVIIFAFTDLKMYTVHVIEIIIHGVLNNVSFCL